MSETARLVIAVDSRQVGQADNALNSLGRTSSTVSKAVSAVTAAFGVRELYQATEAYASIANRMRLVTESAVELRAAQDAVFQSAQTARQPLAATAELYQRIAANQKALNLSGKGVASITDTISKSLAISGASAASANAALIQLGQAFASGTLRGEELNSVMEQAPALSQAIAAGMGVTIGQLRSLGAEGKLTAEAVVKALQDQADAVDEKFSRIASTIGGSLQVAGNSLTRLVGELDQATGATSNLAGGIIGASKIVDTFTGDADALASTVKNVGAVMGGVGAASAVLLASKLGTALYASRAARAANIAQAESAVNAARANQIAAQSAVVRAEREALAARGTAVQTQMSIQLAQARMAEAGATTALSGAQATLRTASAGLLSVLGGPVGLALLVGTMAASYFLFRDGANAATSALIDQNGTLDDSIQKFKELSAEQQRFQSSKWVEAQESALDSASSALAEYATRGSQAFNSLGMSGVESAEAFSVMVAEVKAGTRTLDSVTEWVAKNNQIMPAFKSMLEQTAAAYSANGEKAEKYGKLLAQSSGVTTSATTETEKLAAAQKAAAESSGAKAGEWDKYIAKLTETRDLIGANSAAEAEYNAVKMGASVEQRTQAKLIGEQTVVLKALQEAVKDGDKVEQAALKTKLLGLYTAEEAAKQAAATQKQAYADTATAAEESAKRQAAAFMAVAAASYAPVMANPNPKKLSGYGLLTNGGTSPAVVPEVPETALERYERAIKLINEGTEVNKKTDKAVNAAAKAIENQAKALKDFEAQSAISTKSSNDMADAYLSGADSVRELAIQQKIEEELLKTGAAARDKVVDAVNREADAKDRLDITQSIASMRIETTQTLAQATATLQGKDALEAFNIQKAMTVSLSGKNIEFGSKEYELLLQQTKAQLDANKALEQANTAESVVDRLNPQIKLLRDYTTEQEALNAAIAQGTDKTPLYQDALAKLGLEYEQNKAAATAWGQFTQGAVDRVDESFADAWKNIDKGFKGFADSLVDGFKQLLAELAHMAITKPIIMQIGASLGVGGLSAQSGGLFGGAGGAGGGLNLESAWNSVSGAYSVATSGFGSAVGAGWAGGQGLVGGIQGAFTSGASYVSSAISGAFSSGAAAATGAASNVGYGLGSQLVSGGVGSGGAAAGAGATYASAAATGLSATSAITFGIGGAIAGYLKAGVKGAVAGAGGAVAGAYAGAAIGSAVPVIGTAIGAAVGAVLGGMFGSSLFGGDWVTKDQGLVLGAANGELDASSFEYQKKKGGLFSSNKKRTRLTALDPEMQAALDASYSSTLGSVLGLFESLNVELNSGVLDGLSVAATKISTKDKTAEEVQAEVTSWFGKLGDAATAAVSAATGSGLEGFSFEGLATFVGNLYSVNNSFDALGVKMVDFTVAGGRAVDYLVGMAGGIETLQANVASYYDNFTDDTQKSGDALAAVTQQFAALELVLPGTREAYKDMLQQLDMTSAYGQAVFNAMTMHAASAASAYAILEQRESEYYSAFFSASENTARTTKETTERLKEMGVILPATREGFRDMIEALDTTTATGKAMYNTLMSVAGAAGAVFDALESTAQAAADAAVAKAQAAADLLNAGVSNSFSAVQRAITAQQKKATEAYNATNTSLSDMSATASKAVTDLSTVSNSLESALKSLRGTSDDAVKMLQSQARATLQSALATARSGGSLSGFTGLEDALDTVSDNNTDLYSSLEDFNRDQGRTANVVAELNAINGKQLTAAEKLQEGLETQIDQAKEAYDAQMAQYDQQLEFAQAQMDALNGVDNSIMGVTAAINAMNAAVVAALQGQATGAGKANTPGNNAALVETLYQSVLGRGAEAAGASYWAAKLQSGAVTYQQAAETIAKEALALDASKYQGAVSQAAIAASKAAAAAYLAGQKVPGYATGGLITGPGTGTSDSMMIRASNGEYMMSAAAVRMFGTGLLDQMNAGRLPAFAMGGAVGETGPHLEITRPSQIYSASSQSSRSGQGGGEAATVAELRGLRREMQTNFEYISKHIKATADHTDEIANRGVPIVGTVDTRVVA
ncbi:tape measure protein [Pseudomonas iridis]|uniref:tape measure protein n=1 Tax=Pseudomonas iridis TaxID=2710587 RepID=UPI0037CC1C90